MEKTKRFNLTLAMCCIKYSTVQYSTVHHHSVELAISSPQGRENIQALGFALYTPLLLPHLVRNTDGRTHYPGSEYSLASSSLPPDTNYCTVVCYSVFCVKTEGMLAAFPLRRYSPGFRCQNECLGWGTSSS